MLFLASILVGFVVFAALSFCDDEPKSLYKGLLFEIAAAAFHTLFAGISYKLTDIIQLLEVLKLKP